MMQFLISAVLSLIVVAAPTLGFVHVHEHVDGFNPTEHCEICEVAHQVSTIILPDQLKFSSPLPAKNLIIADTLLYSFLTKQLAQCRGPPSLA